MISRALDWLDESAAGLIRVAYLLAGVLAVAAYFGSGHIDVSLANTLDAVQPWTLAAALEIHTYLTARRVRAGWQQLQASTEGAVEYEQAMRSMRVNLAILAGLLAFSMYNQLEFLAATWTPPHTALSLPDPAAFVLRAMVTPAAFMAAAFLAPMGESLPAQVKAEAHRVAAATFRVARTQWRARLAEMQRSRQDVTTALVQLIDDPQERRIVETIHAAMYPLRGASPAHLPTGPGTPLLRAHTNTQQATGSSEEAESAPSEIVRLASARGMGAHRPAALRRPSAVKARKVRAEREARIAGWLAEDPTISTRELARRLHCSESHALDLRRTIEARRSVALVPQEVAQ